MPIESFCIKYALSLPDLKATLEGLLSNNEATETNTEEWKHKKVEIEERLKFYQQHLVVKKKDVSDCTYVIDECLWTVPPCMRWHLYRYTVAILVFCVSLFTHINENNISTSGHGFKNLEE